MTGSYSRQKNRFNGVTDISVCDIYFSRYMPVENKSLTSGTVWSIHSKIAAELALCSFVLRLTPTRSVAVITIIALFNSKYNDHKNNYELMISTWVSFIYGAIYTHFIDVLI